MRFMDILPHDLLLRCLVYSGEAASVYNVRATHTKICLGDAVCFWRSTLRKVMNTNLCFYLRSRHRLVGDTLEDKPRPFANAFSGGWGLGSCYINSAIQFVFSSLRVRSLLARLVSMSSHHDGGLMERRWRFCNLVNLREIQAAQNVSNGCIDDLTWALTFAASMQVRSVTEDSEQSLPLYPSLFLCCSYEGNQDDPMDFLFGALRSSPYISQHFEGRFHRAVLKCKTCGKQSYTRGYTDECRFTSLQVQGDHIDVLSAVLDSYNEELDDDFAGFCCNENCGMRWSHKYQPIDKVPRVLLIQIGRWHFSMSMLQRRPSSMHLDKTLTLNGATYHLSGIMYHAGVSPVAGHYVAVALHESYTQSFFVYNDCHCWEVSGESLTSDAYLPGFKPKTLFHATALLYERQ